jgi:thiamine biosynthesis lipoprotein
MIIALAKQRARLAFLALPVVYLSIGCTRRPPQAELMGETMGTSYTLKVVPRPGERFDRAAAQAGIDKLLEKINAQMSVYDPRSEISRFNRQTSATPAGISPEFLYVVDRALYWCQKTSGAFDITVPPLLDLWGFGPGHPFPLRPDSLPSEGSIAEAMADVGCENLRISDGKLVKSRPGLRIDLGAIAKGYGVDAVFEYLASEGLRDFMVEIGGEVRARGRNRAGTPWRLGIAKPLLGRVPSPATEWVIALDNQAVATSGDYEDFFQLGGRVYSHEMDARTGRPASNGIASATVTAPLCIDADALATTLMVMEPDKGLALIESLPDTEAFLIVRGGRGGYQIMKTRGFVLQ